jgi:AcrR family transcriptional regulator
LRKQPKQQRAQALVEAAVEATARILAREGRARLTTNRIAEVAGISVGSLYQYFADKQELVAEVRQRFEARFQARFAELAARVGGLPLGDAVAALVDALVELHAEDPQLHNELGTGTPAEARSPLHALVTGYLASRAHELRRPDPALAAHVLLQAAESLVHETALHSPERLADPAFAAEVRDLLVRYLVRDAPAPPPLTPGAPSAPRRG